MANALIGLATAAAKLGIAIASGATSCAEVSATGRRGSGRRRQVVLRCRLGFGRARAASDKLRLTLTVALKRFETAAGLPESVASDASLGVVARLAKDLREAIRG
jgi:hypothetical protein